MNTPNKKCRVKQTDKGFIYDCGDEKGHCENTTKGWNGSGNISVLGTGGGVGLGKTKSQLTCSSSKYVEKELKKRFGEDTEIEFE